MQLSPVIRQGEVMSGGERKGYDYWVELEQ